MKTPVPDNGTCVFTRASGIRSVDDWFGSKKTVNIGGHGPGSSLSDTPRLIKAAIDPPMKLTEGYQGTAIVRLAMERGEMDGLCGWGWSSVKGTDDQSQYTFASSLRNLCLGDASGVRCTSDLKAGSPLKSPGLPPHPCPCISVAHNCFRYNPHRQP